MAWRHPRKQAKSHGRRDSRIAEMGEQRERGGRGTRAGPDQKRWSNSVVGWTPGKQFISVAGMRASRQRIVASELTIISSVAAPAQMR